MTNFRFSGIAAAFCFGLFFLHPPVSAGQDISPAQVEAGTAGSDSLEPYKVSLSVNEVRIDVVVVDKKGRPITDLTPDDFEIYQSRLPQQIKSSVYIGNQAESAAMPASSRKDSTKLPQFPAPMLKEEEVNRTILFVVDNLSMDYPYLHYAKTAVKNFTEKQMLPGDMVAVVRTGYGNSAVDFFSSDRRHINARTDSIPVQGLIDYVAEYIVSIDDTRVERLQPCEGAFAPMVYDNQLSALSYSIRAMKDMPGRKILFFVTACPYLPSAMPINDPAGSDDSPILYVAPFDNVSGAWSAESYTRNYNRLADEALRAGVVVHSLDARGLEYELSSKRDLEIRGELNPLPAKTGGIYVMDQNFFADGIGRDANNMIAGYYLVTYVPPPTTFNLSRRNVFHRVEVKVKRKGAVVYTRDGFYGRTESETDSGAPPEHPLQNAVFSPFKHADLNVNIAAGYVKDAKAGYLVRSWIHVDPKDVTIVETEDGGARIDIETVCLTSDVNGNVHDLVDAKYTFNADPEKKAENLEWIRKHGIRFSLLLPVKKPGSYAVRIAVRDAESGRIGSAWQSVEIPDLKKKGVALSNVFMITSADDLNWIRSEATEEITGGVFSLMFQEGEVRSPALRTYMPGDRLQTLAMLYNADAKAIAGSEIEIRTILFKDGNEFLRGDPVRITPDKVDNPDGIPLLNRFTVGSNMPPGDYVLQLLATDKNSGKRKERAASGILGFTVIGR